MLLGAVAAGGTPSTPVPDPPTQPTVSHRGWPRQMGAPFFVQSITQDRHGFLWVGSADGLFRFDGVSFEPIAPAKGHKRTALAVSSLAAAPNGDIWVGYAGSGGVAVYRGSALIDAKLPGAGAEITKVVIDKDGNPWVNNSGGGEDNILRWLRGRWLPVRGPDGKSFEDVIDLARAPDGSMWALSEGRIYVARPDGRQFEASSITGDKMGAFASSDQGMLLSDTSGVRRIVTDPGGLPVRTIPVAAPVPTYNILRTLMDRQGVLWGTTSVNGVFYGGQGKPFTHLTETQGVTSDRSSAIFLDRSGNVWTGSEGGLDRFSKPIVETAPTLPANPQHGFNLLINPAGQAFVAAGDTIWDMSSAPLPRAFAKLPSDPYSICGGTDGRIWAVIEAGLVEIRDGRTLRTLPWPIEPMGAPRCTVRKDGTVFAVIPNTGLFRSDGTSWARVPLPSHVEEISDLRFDDRNRLVLVINRQNVAIVDGHRVSFWEGGKIRFERPTSINFLSGDVVIGGLTGLLRIQGTRLSRLDFETYPWLRDIRGMVTVPDGYIWLLGHKGISRVRQSDLEAAFNSPGRPIAYQLFDDDNAAIGVPQRAGGPQAGLDRNGIIWFLTRQRVLRAQPKRAVVNEVPVVVIRSAVVDGQKTSSLDRLRLPGGARTVSFDFSVADLTTPTHRRFRYRVEGYDSQWTEIGGRRQVNLTNMGPGSYKLVVETDDERGQWVAPGAGLEFTIAPMLHQTWWFRLLAALAAIGVVWLLVRWRIRAAADGARREAESRLSERMRIARDLHDTFLQGFQGSALRLQAVADRLPEESRERQGLEKVLRGVDDILEEGRRRVQSLRSEDVPVNIEEAVEALAGDLLGAEACHWKLETTGNPQPVTADAADEILLIVREALANIVRHAQASNVDLTLSFSKNQMEIVVVDDGIGIDAATSADRSPTGHYGLVGMRERAELINAALTIEPAEPGTRVSLVVPGRRAYAVG